MMQLTQTGKMFAMAVQVGLMRMAGMKVLVQTFDEKGRLFLDGKLQQDGCVPRGAKSLCNFPEVSHRNWVREGFMNSHVKDAFTYLPQALEDTREPS